MTTLPGPTLPMSTPTAHSYPHHPVPFRLTYPGLHAPAHSDLPPHPTAHLPFPTALPGPTLATSSRARLSWPCLPSTAHPDFPGHTYPDQPDGPSRARPHRTAPHPTRLSE